MRRLIAASTEFLKADPEAAPHRYAWAREELAKAIGQAVEIEQSLDFHLSYIIETIKTANSAGNPVLQHWVTDAEVLLARIRRAGE